ncbi:MAG: type II CAAX endopeptidase family protein [bacterium]|nr:type II CAAX endopeptidase family protein [bacterium]
MEKENSKNIKSILIGIGVIILYLIIYSLSIDFLSIFGINYYELSNPIRQLYLTLYDLSFALIIIYIYKKDFIPNFKDFKQNFGKYIEKYIKYWLLALILMIISNSIITNFTTENVAQNQQSIIDLIKIFPIYSIISIVLIAPLTEELIFRLSIKKIFKNSDILFIIFSGIIFGSLHVITTLQNTSDLLFIIPYSIPGFIFAYCYTKSKNIFTTITLHSIHNTFMLIIQIIALIKR